MNGHGCFVCGWIYQPSQIALKLFRIVDLWNTVSMISWIFSAVASPIPGSTIASSPVRTGLGCDAIDCMATVRFLAGHVRPCSMYDACNSRSQPTFLIGVTFKDINNLFVEFEHFLRDDRSHS